MIKTIQLLAAAAGLALTALGAQAQTGPVVITVGWASLGDVLISGSTLKLTTAYAPGEAGNLSGSNPVDYAALTSAAGLGGTALDLPGEEVTEGSLASQSFSLLTGQSLSFSWSFATSDNSPATSSIDHAFAVINSQVYTLATRAMPGLAAQTFNYIPVAAGTFKLSLGLADTLDYNGVSTLSVSNVQVSALAVPVPEPATAMMWLAGLGVLGGLARARRPAAAQAEL
jgi:hypothetical protein